MTHNQAFTIFGQPIYWYGIIIMCGLVLAILISWARQKRLGLPNDTVLDLSLLMLPIGLICARIYYVIFTWDVFKDNPISVFYIRDGGLAIYGGLIGGVLTAFIYSKRKKISFGRVTDLFAPAVALAQGIGRWGNYVNQEAYGALVTDPKLQFFPVSVFIDATGTWHQATFFYESIWCVLIFVALITFERLGKIRRAGDGFFWYVLLYALERAVVEGMRSDSLMLGTIRISQLLSVLCVIAVLVVFAIRLGRKKGLIAGGALVILLLLFLLVPGFGAWPFSLICLALGLVMYHCLPHEHPYNT